MTLINNSLSARINWDLITIDNKISSPNLNCVSNTGFTIGNAVFSADGSKYAVIDGGYYTLRGWISVFDFNRCTGRLSSAHHKFIRINQYSIGQSVVFSSNGKCLYANTDSILYQIDLSSSGYPMTELATYDGFS